MRSEATTVAIEGAKALVTGAGGGIGRATALALVEQGAAEIVVVDLRSDAALETAAMIEARGARAESVEVDVADSRALSAVFSAHMAGCRIVFNNAGMVSGAPPYPDMAVDRIERVVAVNFTAILLGTQFAVRAMRGRPGGIVVNSCSTAATMTSAFPDAVYASTKAAVLSLTRHCAPFAALHGVRVAAVLPGLTRTGILDETGAGGRSDWMQDVIDRFPMQGPEAVAAGVLRLILDPDSGGRALTVRPEDAEPGAIE